MTDILQEGRLRILARRIGLITDEELIAWADARIMEFDEPPSFIIDLAMGETPVELNVNQSVVSTLECSELMKLVAAKYFLEETDLDQLGSCSYKLALISNGRASELLHWISDEIYLCYENVKVIEDSLPTIKEVIDELIHLPPNKSLERTL